MQVRVHQWLKGKPRKEAYIFENLQSSSEYPSGKLVFCTGMGRSGTHFMAKLFEQKANVSAYHLDHIGNSVADSFFQFAKWYGMDIDMQPLFQSRAFLAAQAGEQGKAYFESNPYINLHVADLAREFQAHMLILYRDPKKVVESHYNKGWYKGYDPVFDAARHQVPGYDYSVEQAHYFFGRFFPKDPEAFERWKNYTRVGKIAWMWSTVYTRILQDVEGLERCRIVPTEKVNHETYVELCRFCEIEPIDNATFEQVLNDKPGKGSYKERPAWTEQETKEFESLTRPVREKLDAHALNMAQ